MNHIENLPKGLDPNIVKQTQQGKGWGKEDQARYDAAIANRSQAKERATEYKGKSETTNNTFTTQSSPYDSKGKPASAAGVKQVQGSQTIKQDNDQSSSITGDKNYSYQNQDNSIRNYGGSNRSFVYNSNGEGPDTPATMATLAGYYAPDDSPGARASRLDQNVTMNRDNQKKYANTSHIAQGAISRAENNSYIDPAKMDKRIQERENYSRAKSTVMAGNIFGDMFNMKTPEWKSADPAKPVETPDFEKMYDKYTDF